MYRGALYTDNLNCVDNLAILPQPEIPEHTLKITEDAIAFVTPPRPLVLDRTQPLAGDVEQPLWDKFVQSIDAMKRPKGNMWGGLLEEY